MNVNFLRKFFMLVLLVVGCAGGAWADDTSSTAVVETLDADGNKLAEYTDLGKAVTAVCSGSALDKGANRTIRLLTDLNYESALLVGQYVNGASIIFDLNGHVINMGNSHISVGKSSKLKIIDGATGGKLNLASGLVIVGNNGEIELASGTCDVGQFSSYGTLTISGGKLNVNFSKPLILQTDDAKVNVTGGLIKECDNQKIFSQYIDKENYEVTEDVGVDGYYAVVPSNAVALNLDANDAMLGAYDKFSDAMSNASATNGTTVRLCADCEIGGFSTDKGNDIRLDLNGHTLTSSSVGLFGVNTATLTITDESASQSGTIISNKSGAIDIDSGATLNIIGGNFISTSGMMFFHNGTINISGGKFSYTGTLTNGLEGSTLSIYGGFFNKNTNGKGYEDAQYSWTNRIVDGFVLIDNSGVEGYPYAVVPGAKLTYGDGTTGSAGVINGVLTLDLKDDESDHNAWVSKIDATGNIENVDVTVKKNFANTNWHAFYVPFDINVSEDLLQNFEIAKIWDTELNLDDNSTTIEFIKLKDGEKISAFTPCLIKAMATGKQDITFPNVTVYKNQTKSIDCSNVEETFTFTGVMENTNINGCYALDSETGILTAIENADAKVTPLKFYMTVESKTPATSIKSRRFAVRVIGDETTDISDISGDAPAKADTAVYNLQGVKVGTSTTGLPTGIYIQNGRKVVVK